MLTIRPRQAAVFSQLEVQKFEDWMVLHLNRFFPEPCRAAGETEVRKLIRHGINRAAIHGFSAKREVCKYIDLMVVFGRHFDTDKRFPWAAEILGKKRAAAPKMHSLHHAATKHLKSL
jgi:hypothetical protein